jgi:diguanylate cyclase (GGDEF)-like protein/PAS domain S-box-containing protein
MNYLLDDPLFFLLLLLSINGIALASLWRSSRGRSADNEETLRREIQERQRVEHLLRNEIALLAKVMETSPVGILILDEQGSIVGASDRAETILSLSKEDISRGAFSIDRWRPIDPWGNSLSPNVLPFYRVLDTRQTVYDSRHTIELPDGRRAILSINASPLPDETNELNGVVFIFEDITERVRVENALLHSEAQFRGIFEQAAVGIAIIDLSGRFIRVNPRYRDLLGYTNEELLERTFFEITYPEDRERDREMYRRLTERGKSFSLEKRYVCQNGSVIWVNLTASAIRDASGEVMYLIGIIEDIDGRKRAVDALRQSIEDLEQRNRDMSLLSLMGDLLQVCLSLEEAYRVIGDRLPSLFPGCHGGLFTRADDSDLVELSVSWNEPVYSKTIFSLEECWATRRGQTHHVDRDCSHLFCDHIRSDNLARSFCVPMTSQGQIGGLLYLNTEDKNYLNEAKRQFARTVAEQLSLALGNLRLRESLQKQSVRDSLTDLYNYRYMQDALEREVQLARRKGHPIGVMMLDVDYFRDFNNTYGHDAGNVVLQEVGRLLRSSVRSVDIACRYGGEEFLLILPEISPENLLDRAEQIRTGIQELRLTFQDRRLPAITVSIGVADFPRHGRTTEELIRSADTALFRAKASGRDRVIAYEPAGEESREVHEGSGTGNE